jgi:hypothetical protein
MRVIGTLRNFDGAVIWSPAAPSTISISRDRSEHPIQAIRVVDGDREKLPADASVRNTLLNTFSEAPRNGSGGYLQ